MAIGDISLSSSARQNLLSLQGTSKLLGQTQSRLASGKKINSALDGASSYFSSQGFLNSANDLSALKDSMSTALQTLKAASDTIESLSTVVDQLKGIVNSALQTTDAATRAGLASQYNALLNQFDLLVADGTFNGTNLVNSINSELKVSFSTTDATDNLTVQGSNLTSGGLGMGDALASFSSTTLVDSTTHSMSVVGANQTLTAQVYSGTLSSLTVAAPVAAGGVGATIASTGSIYGVAATTNGASVVTAAAGTVTNLVTALGSANGSNVVTVTGVTRSSTTATGTGVAVGADISGQFTATSGAGSTYTVATGVLTGGTANTITLGAGQSMSVIYDAGAGADVTTTLYTNTTANAISFTLSAAGDTVTAADAKTNVSRSYKLATGTVATTGLSIPTSGAATLGGNSIVDSYDAAAGETVTYKDSGLSALTVAGTTTAADATAYDVTGATITAVTVTDVTATKTGATAVTYAATNAHVSMTGVSTLSDDKTIVTADALTSAQNQLTSALNSLRTASSGFGNNNTIVSTRQDFTNSLITTLQAASDGLVLADTNEEGANLQALQASSSLGIIALGISGQQAQAILRLF